MYKDNDFFNKKQKWGPKPPNFFLTVNLLCHGVRKDCLGRIY